jgi:predicted kinase
VPEAVLLARLRARNAHPPRGTFVIPEARLREWMGLFQVPDAEELQRRNAPQ